MPPLRYPADQTTVLEIVRQVCQPSVRSPGVCPIHPHCRLVPFRVAAADATTIGLLASQAVHALEEICASRDAAPLVFSRDESGRVTEVAFAGAVNECGFHGRTEALKPIVVSLLERPEFADAKANWNDELVAAAGRDGRPALLIVRESLCVSADQAKERAAEAIFGLTTSAVHCTGYVRNADDTLSIWVARRAAHMRLFVSVARLS